MRFDVCVEFAISLIEVGVPGWFLLAAEYGAGLSNALQQCFEEFFFHLWSRLSLRCVEIDSCSMRQPLEFWYFTNRTRPQIPSGA